MASSLGGGWSTPPARRKDRPWPMTALPRMGAVSVVCGLPRYPLRVWTSEVATGTEHILLTSEVPFRVRSSEASCASRLSDRVRVSPL